MADLAPHLAFPFRWTQTATGQVSAATVEQGTFAEVSQCVEVILRYPQEWRDELPEFGTPRQELAMAPVSPDDVRRAIIRWEPRATVTVSEEGDPIDAAVRRIRTVES
jgi:phage baseplate assembly protein W